MENVPLYVVGQEAEITVTSGRDEIHLHPVIVPDAGSFYTTFQFGPDEVAVGEPINACAYINEDLNECGYTTNSEYKMPEHVNIYLQGSGAGPNEFPSDLNGSGSFVGRYYEGFDWRGVCNNPIVRQQGITQPCEALVTSDGEALTPDGKRAIESVLCPHGRGIIGIIEFAYKPIPDNLEHELAIACGWNGIQSIVRKLVKLL